MAGRPLVKLSISSLLVLTLFKYYDSQSLQVKSLWEEGEIHDSKAASRLARRWSIAGLIFGALIIVATVTGFAVRHMWYKWKVDFEDDGESSAE